MQSRRRVPKFSSSAIREASRPAFWKIPERETVTFPTNHPDASATMPSSLANSGSCHHFCLSRGPWYPHTSICCRCRDRRDRSSRFRLSPSRKIVASQDRPCVTAKCLPIPRHLAGGGRMIGRLASRDGWPSSISRKQPTPRKVTG
jgi:hypothetical protein